MEPVFMICGESAGIAAVQAINENVSVQKIDQVRYLKKLRILGQILENSSVKSSVKN
jgi:coenzyme F420-reducing hydrogenase alpha subunit